MSNWKTQFYEQKVKPFEKYEMEASERIKKLYNVDIYELFNKNNGNKYDFKDSNDIKYEVKYDGYSVKSGNFFIEYKGYDKPSGISTTQAKFYIITDGDKYFMIDTQLLIKLCNEYGNIKQTKDKLTYGYCINRNIIIFNSQLI